jgi:hypothetical protein
MQIALVQTSLTSSYKTSTMDKAAFDEYVENRYKGQMKYYSEASKKNQTKYRKFQWILIVLSAATPILAALNEKPIKINNHSYTFDLQIFVIVIAAIVAILTTGLKTFGYQELWLTYRTTYEKLKPEIYYHDFGVGPYSENGVDKNSLFVARIEAILDAEHNKWPPAKKLREEGNKDKEEQGSTGSLEVGNSESSTPKNII